jgi:hypothetical protein
MSEQKNKLGKLNEFINKTLCDKSIVDKLQRSTDQDMANILNKLCSQSAIQYIQKEIDVYAIDFEKNKIKNLTRKEMRKIKNKTNICMQSDRKNLLLHIITPKYMTKLLLEKSDNKYFFIPMTLYDSAKEYSHQVSIIIDKINKKIYLFDPNGHSTYYNNTAIYQYYKCIGQNVPKDKVNEKYQNNHLIIDKLLAHYFSLVDQEYEYISSQTWNKDSICLNMYYDEKSIIGHGHCVAITIMIMHLLFLQNISLEEAIKILGELSIDNRILIIGGYSKTIYDMFLIKKD